MVKLDLDIPTTVIALLRNLSDVLGPEYQVTLAGGFLRDTYGGAQIKDIDILINPMEEGYQVCDKEILSRITTSNFMRIWFEQTDDVIDTNYMQGMKARGVKYLIMGRCPLRDNQETQLIIYDRPMSRKRLARDMDMNICQIACGPDGQVVASDEFIEGFQKKHITILNGQGDDREIERVQRMQTKYPGFTADSVSWCTF